MMLWFAIDDGLQRLQLAVRCENWIEEWTRAVRRRTRIFKRTTGDSTRHLLTTARESRYRDFCNRDCNHPAKLLILKRGGESGIRTHVTR